MAWPRCWSTGGSASNSTTGKALCIWPATPAAFSRLVSAAKAALEAYVRQLALELAPRGITANAIRAGVTETAALHKIPDWEKLRDRAMATNPAGRLTCPEDVAAFVSLLVEPGAAWVSGNVLGVDGGEDVVG